VRGAEYFRVSELAARPDADSHLFDVFARNVVGSMDYTPVVFEDGLAESDLPYAHSLAQAVLFESGLQHFADRADVDPTAGYRAVFAAFPFVAELLAAVPVSWDDTLLVGGTPHSHAVLARRKGDTWWLAGIAGNDDTVELAVPLSFLADGLYDVELATRDPADPRGLTLVTSSWASSDTLELTLAPRDGFLARLVPQ